MATNDKDIRDISLQALANSPTPADREYLSSLIPSEGKVPEDILDAYLKSTRNDSVKKWLTVVRDHKIDPDYVFFVDDQHLLTSDSMLDSLKDTIRKTRNHKVLEELPRALEDRKDNDSVNLLIQLL